MKKFITIIITVLFLNISATYSMSEYSDEITGVDLITGEDLKERGKKLKKIEIEEAETRVAVSKVQIKNKIQKFFESKGIYPSANLAEIIGDYAIISVEQIFKANHLISHAHYKNCEDLERLLENGANVNHKDDAGWTPLMHAVVCDQKDKIRLLIKARADINIKNNHGQSPLDQANPEIKKILLRKEISCIIS